MLLAQRLPFQSNMGSKGPSSEDPMDLGGFMANYVLKNPFDGPPLDQDHKPTVATKSTAPRRATPSPPLQSSDSPVDLSQSHTKVSPTLMTGHNSPLASQSDDGEDSIEHADRKEDYDLTGKKSSWVTDTPKYHIGSNMVYAASLKNKRVSMFNRDVQTWLLSNFRHDPGCGDQVAMSDILQPVVLQFPHVNSVSLSRIMKFTFPDCQKSVTKHGSIYRDLTVAHSGPPIPQPSVYRNLPLVMAANQVKLNNMRLEVAAEKYGVDADQISQLSMYHADDACVPLDPILEKQIDQVNVGSLQKVGERKLRRKRSHPECGGNSGQEWQPPMAEGNVTRVTGSSRRKSGRVRKVKKFDEFVTEDGVDELEHSKRKMGRLEDMQQFSVKGEYEDDGEASNDSNLSVGHGDGASPDAVVSGFPLLRQLLEKHGLPPSLVRGTIRRHNEEYLVGDFEQGMSQDASCAAADLTSVSQSCDSASSVQVLNIKEEPLDLGYDRCSSSQSRRDESVSSSCSNISSGGPASQGSPTVSQSSPPIVQHGRASPCSELQQLQNELGAERLARRQLENELVSARQDTTELQTAMANKHIELLDLARDFHALNGAFKSLSRKFKTVLEESVFQNGLVHTPQVMRPRRPLAEDVEV